MQKNLFISKFNSKILNGEINIEKSLSFVVIITPDPQYPKGYYFFKDRYTKFLDKTPKVHLSPKCKRLLSDMAFTDRTTGEIVIKPNSGVVSVDNFAVEIGTLDDWIETFSNNYLINEMLNGGFSEDNFELGNKYVNELVDRCPINLYLKSEKEVFSFEESFLSVVGFTKCNDCFNLEDLALLAEEVDYNQLEKDLENHYEMLKKNPEAAKDWHGF